MAKTLRHHSHAFLKSRMGAVRVREAVSRPLLWVLSFLLPLSVSGKEEKALCYQSRRCSPILCASPLPPAHFFLAPFCFHPTLLPSLPSHSGFPYPRVSSYPRLCLLPCLYSCSALIMEVQDCDPQEAHLPVCWGGGYFLFPFPGLKDSSPCSYPQLEY